MQLAEILSDLVSLRPGVCVSPVHTQTNTIMLTRAQDPHAALALVSARPDEAFPTATATTTSAATPPTTPAAPANATQNSDAADADLERANALVALHYDVRARCKTGELGRGLAEARRAVDLAMG